MHLHIISLLSVLASTSLAVITFTEPAAGAAYKAGAILTISWEDAGLAGLTNYVIQLCAGGNTAGSYTPLATLKSSGTFASGNTVTGVSPIPAAIGGNSPNGYFLMITASGTSTVTNFSPRFGLTGMTGTFPANVQSGIAQIGSSTAGPTDTTAADTVPDVAASPVAPTGAFAVPYGMQTGPIRYAPMQPQPGTKITASVAKPLFPTSQAVLAVAAFPPASVQTTVTQSRPATVTSIENTASPQPMPNDPMQKWLNRWKD